MSQEGLMTVDGYDAAIIGIHETEQDFFVVVYDKWAMVDIYMAQYPDATWDDAVEDLSFNTWGAYYGELTPIFMHTFRGTEEEKRMDLEEYFYDIVE